MVLLQLWEFDFETEILKIEYNSERDEKRSTEVYEGSGLECVWLNYKLVQVFNR